MLKVIKLTKINERMFYDSWWMVETNQGNIKLHQYDCVDSENLKNKIENMEGLNEVKELEPKNFYFD